MWKKFSFFTAELLQSADPGSPLYSIQALDVTCVTSGRGSVIFGDSEGGITLCDEEFALRRFSAYEQNVNFAYQYKSSNVLLTIGNGVDYRDEENASVSRNLATRFRTNLNSNETYKWMLEDLHIPSTLTPNLTSQDATLKLWLLDKIDEDGQPLLLRALTLFEKVDEETITSLVVDESNQLIVFGCSNGHIYYIHGDLLRVKKASPTLLPRHFSSSITSLFVVPSETDECVHIFATSEKKVGCYHVTLDAKVQVEYNRLDDIGCHFNCSCLDAQNHLVIGKDEGLFFYTPAKRISTCALPEKKSFISRYHDSVIVGTSNNKNQSTLTFYNINNTCEVFSMAVLRNGNAEDVQFLFTEWKYCFIMTEGHIVYLLREKDVAAKLNILYEREVFTTALSLSEDWNLSEKETSSIHQHYALYLYEKKDYERAMTEFIATIGHVDASFVIRRYLDSAMIHQLIRYLEELHKHGSALSDHTLLLMNCYIKLRDNEKLQAFIYESALGTSYNAVTASTALAEAGYNKEALYLAKQNGLSELYLTIQVEKACAYTEAVEYIQTLPLPQAEKALIRYGKVLIDAISVETTNLMIEIATNYHGQNCASNPELFVHCFVTNANELKRFLLAVTATRESCDPTIWNMLLELLLRDASNSKEDTQKVLDLLHNPAACYDHDEALILLQNSHCEEGLVFIYKKLRMTSILLKLYVDLKRYDEAIQLCKEEKVRNHSIWMDFLMYFAKHEVIEQEELEKVVNAVELSGYVSLFEIVHTLVDNPAVPSQYVRELIKRQLTREKNIRDSDVLKEQKLQGEIEKTKQELDRYQKHGFVFKQTRCVGCGLPLELPVVQFICGHSYHKACVGTDQINCSKCAIHHQERIPADDSMLLRELQESKDGFAFAADCFGKDLFKPEVEEEEDTFQPQPEMNETPEEDVDAIPMQTLDLLCVCFKTRLMSLLTNHGRTESTLVRSIHSKNSQGLHAYS